MSRRRLLAAAMAALAEIWFAPWSALAAEKPSIVAHGREVGRQLVGPEAAGRSSGRRVPGATISDSTRPDYARLIKESSTYDGFAVHGPHLLIEDVEIEGALDLGMRLPVVLRRATVSAVQDVPWLVLVRPEAGPVHFLWCDIGAVLRKRSAVPYVGVALALRGNGVRVYRSRIGAAADGIQIAARNVRVAESHIADLLSKPGDHNDAIQLFEQSADIEVSRSRIENRHPQTSAITLLGRDVVIASNLLAGGGWTLYGGALRNGKGGDGASGVRVEDNIFSRGLYPKVGTFGPVTYWQAGPQSGNVWRANRDDQDRPIVP